MEEGQGWSYLVSLASPERKYQAACFLRSRDDTDINPTRVFTYLD